MPSSPPSSRTSLRKSQESTLEPKFSTRTPQGANAAEASNTRLDEHPDLAEARQVAQRQGINLAVSNPCIELWFVLHLEDQFAYIHRHEVQRRSAELFGFDKRLDTKTLDRLTTLYPVAEARAEALDMMYEQNGSPEGSNPSTSMAPLVEAIRS